MSSGYKIRDAEQTYFVTFTVVYWIDAFIRREHRNIVIESIKYCQEKKGLVVHGWCLMTSHLHLIISKNGEKNLESIVRDMKSHISRAIHEELSSTDNNYESRRHWMLWMMERAGKRENAKFNFWQTGYHPIEITNKEIMKQKLEYIHNNPVVEGLVEEAWHWPYSSAKDYADIKGLIEIDFLF